MNLTHDRNLKLLDTLASRETLRAIIADPVFIAAMSVIQEECRVTKSDLDKHIDAVLTRRTAYHSGVSDVPDSLRSLLSRSTADVPEDEEPFDYITPEQP
jgi:hypothetical protein